jgi:Fur family ferric uptake transcriptional regulator
VKAQQLLKDFDLRNTQSRLEILQAFEDKHKALSQAEIENQLIGQFDRVTVYRTLRTFLQKGILHKVLDDEGTPKYALCGSHCVQETHRHEHVHFKCVRCGNTTCLEQVMIPVVQLPASYSIQEMNLLIQGVCSDCHD